MNLLAEVDNGRFKFLMTNGAYMHFARAFSDENRIQQDAQTRVAIAEVFQHWRDVARKWAKEDGASDFYQWLFDHWFYVVEITQKSNGEGKIIITEEDSGGRTRRVTRTFKRFKPPMVGKFYIAHGIDVTKSDYVTLMLPEEY